MKDLVEFIKGLAPGDWDGEFMALKDSLKDLAIERFLKSSGQKHLEDIFPVCFEGAYERMVTELYSRPESFKALYIEMTRGHETEERYVSEACNSAIDTLTNYKLLHEKRAHDLAEFWKKAAYYYCEDMLREACAGFFDSLND